jgi:hypothetical protein
MKGNTAVTFGGRIKRGPMAADVFEAQFTQVYNGLFRDPRLSFKAKGIFGLISTHRDGFGLSLEAIAARATDGVSGVRSGLRELIEFNYLQRDRARDARGRLGESIYFITDMPDGLLILMNPEWDKVQGARQKTRSEPTCDFPHVDEPTVGSRTHKKTTPKNTIQQNTTSVPPSGPAARGPRSRNRTERTAPPRGGATARRSLAPSAPALPAELQAGADVLNAIARECGPEYLLTGEALADQSRKVIDMLAAGWTPEQLRQIVAGEPWPETITTSRPAIIAARLRRAHAGPAPAHAAALAHDAHPARRPDPATWTPPPWTGEVQSRWVECEDCGRPVQPGSTRCAPCMDWPVCAGRCGRRVDPADRTALCRSCDSTPLR